MMTEDPEPTRRFIKEKDLIIMRRGLDTALIDPWFWSTWRKTTVTQALRINGPFETETAEGSLKCEDGYLAVDARGYPYPIAAEEFALVYELVEEGEMLS